MKDEISNILSDVFQKVGYEITVNICKSKFEGVDFQCDDLFKLAKKYHEKPFEIGDKVVSYINSLDNFNEYFKSVSYVNPGFINICVSDKFINDSLRKLMEKNNFGFTDTGKTIVLDYGGPNVAKPLHVGHLRTAIIGQAINNILKFTGNKIISDVHLGDIGTQMGQVIYGILEDFPDGNFNITLDYLNETYPRVSALCKEDSTVRDKCLEITKKLQDGDAEYKKLWDEIYEVSVSDIKRLYDYLSVSFDYWYGESDSYKYFDEMLRYLNDKNLIREDDGALVIDVKEDDDKIEMPPCIIQKSDGAYLYATSDLGTIWQRQNDFHPDDIIYVVDARQSLHFTQVFRVVRKSEFYKGDLEFCGYGTVNGKDNKPFKTRSGGSFKLDDLILEVKKEFISLREDNKDMDEEDLDKIVNAIIKFADLQNDLTRNYIFDINKFCSVNGKTGPYILYTYLRVNKLLSSNDGKLSDKIYNDVDRSLRLKLLEVYDVVDVSQKERKPHHIASYMYDLCTISNNFYESNKMSELEGSIRNDYDIVLSYNNFVIKTLLKLLGIEIPKKM